MRINISIDEVGPPAAALVAIPDSRTLNCQLVITVLFLLLTIFNSSSKLSAQSLQFQQITPADGLPDGWVHDVMMDRAGIIWLATHDGLSRYDGHHFKNYQVNKHQKEALPGAVLMEIKEGENGIYWIACNGIGLVHFDARQERFKGYTYNPNDTTSISSLAATTLLMNPDGTLWVGTFDGGLNHFDSATETFKRYPLPKIKGYENNTFIGNSVRHILKDPLDDQKLWLATHLGIIHFDTRTGQMDHYPLSHNGSFAFVVHLYWDEAVQKIWVSAENQGLIAFDPVTKKATYHLEDKSIASVCSKSKNKLWIATKKNGLGIFTKINQHLQMITADPTNDYSILSNYTDGFYLDPQGQLWVRDLNEGLSVTNGRSPVFKKPEISAQKWEKLIGEKKFAFDPIHQQLLVAAVHNFEILIFDKKNNNYHFNKIFKLPQPEDIGDEGFLDMVTQDNGQTWVLMKEKHRLVLYEYLIKSDQLQKVEVAPLANILVDPKSSASMALDRQGRLWLAFENGKLVSYKAGEVSTYQLASQQESDFDPKIHQIYIDQKNTLWACSFTDGAFSLDLSSQQEKHYPYDKSENGLDAWRILSITEVNPDFPKPTNRHQMWVGTSALGIQQLNPEEPPLQFMPTFDQHSGMPDNKIFGLKTDTIGNVWIATLRGLVRFNQATRQFQQFGKKEALESIFLKYGFDHLSTNEIMIGLPVGFQFFKPNDLLNTQPTRLVQFSEMSVNGSIEVLDTNIYYQQHIALEPDENYFTIKFSAAYFDNQDKIKYRYKLEDYDPSWTKTELGLAQATYTNIPPGKYQFLVEAANSSGTWSGEPTSLNLTIRPYWYWGIPAKTIYLFTFFGLLGYFIYSKRKQIKEKIAQKQQQLELLERTVTERTAEVVQQKERAEQSEKYKEQFLANMSHEIRTPMHAIAGMTKILKRNQTLPEQEPFLAAIQQSSTNLIVILNDILDLSKIEAGKIRIDPIPMNPREVIDKVMDILRYKAEDKGLQFSAVLDPNLPNQIISDPTRLTQILINLVGNAIKFTEEGFIKIMVRQMKEEDDQNWLEFAIQDTGIGVSDELSKTIFESFEQGDKSQTRKYGGTGLGLNISKQLVELQNGKIWVESQVNQGSIFYFTLPLNTVEMTDFNDNRLSETDLKRMGQSLSGLNILLAEDNSFNVMVATDDLQFFFPEVTIHVAENGRQAVELFQQNNYDLVLMDVHMPLMNGHDASNEIRAYEQQHSQIDMVPIVAMTASLLESEIKECFQAGMNSYIPKPYSAEELVKTIFEVHQDRLAKKLSKK